MHLELFVKLVGGVICSFASSVQSLSLWCRLTQQSMCSWIQDLCSLIPNPLFAYRIRYFFQLKLSAFNIRSNQRCLILFCIIYLMYDTTIFVPLFSVFKFDFWLGLCVWWKYYQKMYHYPQKEIRVNTRSWNKQAGAAMYNKAMYLLDICLVSLCKRCSICILYSIELDERKRKNEIRACSVHTTHTLCVRSHVCVNFVNNI